MNHNEERSGASDTTSWYNQYRENKGRQRNDPVRNPGVMFQILAMDVSVARAIIALGIDVSSTTILDVGCGASGSALNLLRLGFEPSLMHGIDIRHWPISEAKRKLPNVHFTWGDASNMPYADSTFDIVFESTMFIQVIDDVLAADIAREMLRVVKPNGYLILVDWRYAMPGNLAYRALTKKRISRMFQVGKETRVHGRFGGALIPPVGRFLSSYLSSAYFITQRVFPFLIGQQTTVLQAARKL